MDFEFTEIEKEWHTEMRGLAKDGQGRLVLVGLTYEETARLMDHRRAFGRGERRHEDKRAMIELHNKHERARLEIIGAEVESRGQEKH